MYLLNVDVEENDFGVRGRLLARASNPISSILVLHHHAMLHSRLPRRHVSRLWALQRRDLGNERFPGPVTEPFARLDANRFDSGDAESGAESEDVDSGDAHT